MQSRTVLLAAGVILLTALPPAALPVQAGSKTFTVTTIADENGACDATCSLREAITEANTNAGADTIEFDIPGAGPHTIAPDSPLPDITDTVTIDGYSQNGAEVNTLPAPGGIDAVLQIVLDGSSFPPVGFPPGLRLAPGAKSSVIKGLVIANMRGAAITVEAAKVRIEGTFLGTNADGTAAAGNDLGIVLGDGNDTVVGGTRPERRNLISGNDRDAILIGNVVQNVRIEGNLIGTDIAGTGNLGNGEIGVEIIGGNKHIAIGGTAATAANVIAFNAGAGVNITATGAVGNRILRNSIFGNGGLGVDLDDDGVTANDPKDPDPGPNRLQNFPELTSATFFPLDGQTTIEGTLDSSPETKFTIQFFATPPDGGFDEGKIFLGQKSVTTNKKGKASFSFTTDAPVLIVDSITATATNKRKKDTSEFAAAVGVSIG